MKKILIITTNFPPSSSIGTQRILKILKFLDKKEYKPYVLTLENRFFNDQDHLLEPYAAKTTEATEVIRTAKLDINNQILNLRNRIRNSLKRRKTQTQKNNIPQEISKTKKNSIFTKISTFLEFPDHAADWIPYAVFHGYKMIKKEKIDIIFSSSPKHSCHLSTIILKKLTNKKAVIEFRDPWARVPWKTEKRNEDRIEKFKHFLLICLEKWVVRKADQVILVTEEMNQDFQKHYPGHSHKFRTIYNGFDSELQNAALPAKPSGRMFIFSHIGSLYQKRNPEPIIHAFRNILLGGVQRSERDIQFRFVGQIADYLDPVMNLPKSLGIEDNVRFIQKVSYSKSLEMMAQSHVLVVLQPFTKLQVPGKIFDYMNLGKPILGIGEKDGAVDHIVRNRLGVFCEYSDISDIEAGILDIICRYDHYQKMVLTNRSEFDFSQLIKQFEQIIASA